MNAEKASNDKTNVSLFIIIHMYNKKIKHIIYWLKKKVSTIITAFMLGIANAVNDEDKSVFNSQYKIEQQDKKD